MARGRQITSLGQFFWALSHGETALIVGEPDNFAYVARRDKRAVVTLADRRAFVKRREKRVVVEL